MCILVYIDAAMGILNNIYKLKENEESFHKQSLNFSIKIFNVLYLPMQPSIKRSGFAALGKRMHLVNSHPYWNQKSSWPNMAEGEDAIPLLIVLD